MLEYSFDRFYVVTKFMLPTIGDIKFSKLNFDHTCTYMKKEYAPNTDSRNRILAKFYLLNTLITPKKLQKILTEVKRSLHITNPDYTLVLDRLYLYWKSLVWKAMKCGF